MTETFKKLTCKAQKPILVYNDDWSALRYKQSPA